MRAERRTRIKFCGLTLVEEVEIAVDAGADALGTILAPSPRQVGFDQARAIAAAVPPFVQLFAVFVDAGASDVRLMTQAGAAAQFHGSESPEFCEDASPGPYLKAFHVAAGSAPDAAAVDAFAQRFPRGTILIDSRIGDVSGGTGHPFAWAGLCELTRRRRIVVSGGLTPENVGDCIRQIRPYGVDVRSGIESAGRKDTGKMRAFVQAVRAADAQA